MKCPRCGLTGWVVPRNGIYYCRKCCNSFIDQSSKSSYTKLEKTILRYLLYCIGASVAVFVITVATKLFD